MSTLSPAHLIKVSFIYAVNTPSVNASSSKPLSNQYPFDCPRPSLYRASVSFSRYNGSRLATSSTCWSLTTSLTFFSHATHISLTSKLLYYITVYWYLCHNTNCHECWASALSFLLLSDRNFTHLRKNKVCSIGGNAWICSKILLHNFSSFPSWPVIKIGPYSHIPGYGLDWLVVSHSLDLINKFKSSFLLRAIRVKLLSFCNHF